MIGSWSAKLSTMRSELLEKASAELQPELLTAPVAREVLAAYARAERLAAFGVAALARKLDDASELARVKGTSIGNAKAVVATGKALGGSDELSSALQLGRDLTGPCEGTWRHSRADYPKMA
jgi:electron transfer flavoprotein alpha subunit